MKDNLRAYDGDTGERLAVINLTGRPRTKRRFVMVFVDVPSFTTDSKLTDFETRLFMYLVSNMNDSNEVRLLQEEIAKELSTTQSRVSRSLKALEIAGYLNRPHRGITAIKAEFAWRDALTKNAVARRRE